MELKLTQEFTCFITIYYLPFSASFSVANAIREVYHMHVKHHSDTHKDHNVINKTRGC